MRSRARLIEVLKTVNRTVYPSTASRLLGVLQCFERGEEGACLACQDTLQSIAAEHPSPHIRELADEALHYIKGGSDGQQATG